MNGMREIKKEDFVIEQEVYITKIEICKCNSFIFYLDNGDIQTISCKNIDKMLWSDASEFIEKFKIEEVEECKRCQSNIGLDTCSCLSGEEFFKCMKDEQVCRTPSQKSYIVYKVKQKLFR